MLEAPLYVPVEISRGDGDLSRRGGSPPEEDDPPRSGPRRTGAAGSSGGDRPRWFRLAIGISEGSVRLRSALPDELREGPILLRLHLPQDLDPQEVERDPNLAGPLTLIGVAGEVIVNEGTETEASEARVVHLRSVADAMRARIARYVTQRLDSTASSG